MKKSIGSIFLVLIFPLVLLSGCASGFTPVSPATETSVPTPAPWSLVAVGDSIATNSMLACPGCSGFVSRYAKALTNATGHPVDVRNLSQMGGLQIDGLLEELKTDVLRRDALANADIIIVGIGFNDAPWNHDDSTLSNYSSKWSRFVPS